MMAISAIIGLAHEGFKANWKENELRVERPFYPERMAGNMSLREFFRVMEEDAKEDVNITK